MGTFSKFHRFREAGESANVNNVERFGEPVRSLFTSTKLMTVHHRIEITDSYENVVYRAETKFPSLHDKTDLYDASGNHVAHMERKLLTLHQRHFVTMEGGPSFELSNELFHLVKDIINIEGLGWQLRGNIMALNFELYDEKEQIVAVISVTQVLFLDEVGGLILASKLPVNLPELFVIFLERTIISLLIVCPVSHLLF